MEQWWRRNSDVSRGGYTQKEIEDFTGCIPLFLESCVVDKKINLEIEAFYDISQQVIGFVQDIKTRKYPEEWRR